MQYTHPTIGLSCPAPGHHVITNLPAPAVLTDEGWLTVPSTLHIHPDVPSDLLRAILAERDAVGTDSGATLPDRVAQAVADKAMRANELAKQLGVEVAEIVALSDPRFTVGTTPQRWVKLAEAEAEAEEGGDE